MGYNRGRWEFNYDGQSIQHEMKSISNQGVLGLKLDGNWIVSDDTVMQLATARALISGLTSRELLKEIAVQYRACMKDMAHRSPGKMTMNSLEKIDKCGDGWDKIPFNEFAGGCGGSMRSSCIGLLYHRRSSISKLIEVSIESGRMTHHHPTGFIGSFVSALFNSYAIHNIQPKYWPNMFLEHKQDIINYIKQSGRDVDDNIQDCDFYFKFVKEYIDYRNLPRTKEGYGKHDLTLNPKFPNNYHQVHVYDKFYKDISYSGWGGSSGHDSIIIALDALLYSNGDWETLCLHAMLHGGDNDTTGAIAGAWFGSLYGFKGVPYCHYEYLEYVDKLVKYGKTLYKMSN